jgi:hypothetical protein
MRAPTKKPQPDCERGLDFRPLLLPGQEN